MDKLLLSEMSDKERFDFLTRVSKLHNACKLYGDVQYFQTGAWQVWDLGKSFRVFASTYQHPALITFDTIVQGEGMSATLRVTPPRNGISQVYEYTDDVTCFEAAMDIMSKYRIQKYLMIEQMLGEPTVT